jgi:hypothetical protein
MARCAAILLAVPASATAGCVGVAPVGKPTIDLDAAKARSAEIGTRPTTRTRVRQLLGEPWTASEALGVEVYRTTGKQRNLMVIFAPYPVPLPFLSDKLAAYTLVTYDADGQVAVIASDFARAAPGEASGVVIHAGEFEFTHAFRDHVSMSLDGYRQAFAAHASGSACTVLLTCDPARLAEVAGIGHCVCAANRAVDDGPRSMLWVLSPAILPPSPASGGDCHGLGGALLGAGAPRPGICVVNRQNLYPVTLPAGRHRLHFPTGLGGGTGPETELDCRAGEVSYATLGGGFMRCGLFESLVRDDRAVGATVQLSPEPPAVPTELRVIVNDNGRWLFPPDSTSH